MNLIPLTSIIVPPNRQRREFDTVKLQELADKIHSLGLFHPVVVREDGITLVAGERRLRAIKDLHFLQKPFHCHGALVPPGMVPVTKLSSLSQAEIFEAELSENVIRQDLDWREKAEAMAKLAELRSMQQGAPVSFSALAEEVHGRGDGYYGDQVKQSVIVAKHLDNPAIRGAKTMKEAIKILKVEERKDTLKAMGAALPSETIASSHRLIVGDFRHVDLPRESFAVVVCDPPYGIDAQDFGTNEKATGGHNYDDAGGEEWESLMRSLALSIWNLTLPDSHAYVFCDLTKFYWLKALYEEMGFRVWSVPFIMHRTTSVRLPWQEEGPYRAYECILYAVKGHRPCNCYRTDVITVRGDSNLGLSAQKPVAIYQDLLERSARPGESVLDLTCGTGPIFEAAQALKLVATGVELSPQNAAIAAERLERISRGGAAGLVAGL